MTGTLSHQSVSMLRTRSRIAKPYLRARSANIAPCAGLLYMYIIHQKSFASCWQKWADLDDPVIWSAVSGLYTVTNGWFCLLGDAYLWSCVISSSRRVLSVAIAAINIIQSGIGQLARKR